ncbi:sensor domain-containing diguanylate cyclase [Simiduia sp. 21SJ11W-1]|uniref:diguanylate cyclase n=1 Tax=Simiduia sp. 21SJ11W-1 TaxID=2909669 RepID=UPI00209FC505|nr:diguanylate cyclase [Simiduia sp. 21SJ11W-1]UTA48166.1 sensor domain-containing diguanylate cyclase [Simiduia sp. 21SJ11W-1]
MSKLHALCLLLCLVCGGRAEANSDSIPVQANMPVVKLAEHMSLMEDPSGELSLAQVIAGDTPGFTRWHSPSANFGFTASAYWVALTFENTQARPADLFIRQDYPLIDYLDFWYQDANGNWRNHATGDRRQFKSRPVGVRDFVFPLQVPAHAKMRVYFRFKSDGPINISLSVAAPGPALTQVASEQLLFGAYYGGFLVLVIYNLILFLAVKDRVYVFYMVYVVSYGLYMSVHNGLSFQYFWPNSPWLANQSLLLLLGISLLFGLQFSREVNGTQKLAPKTDRVAVVLQMASGVLLLVTPFLAYQQLVLAYSLQTIFVCSVILVLGTLCWLRGSVPARYFMAAWLLFMVSVLVYMFKQFGLLPHNFFTQNSFQMGSLLEMVLLSLALGARVNEMQKLGYSDALTGLANRRHFDERLPKELDQAQRAGAPLSLLVLDIDLFKRINDAHGHAKGDQVIAAVGRILRKNVRRPSFASRYGGEEFAVLLPNTAIDQAQVLAERLRKLVETERPGGMAITASLGVACCEDGLLTAPGALFEAADTALYQAKADGRNQVCLYEVPAASRRVEEEPERS